MDGVREYAEGLPVELWRLDVGNLKENALSKLLSDYPSHGFIIDGDELRDDIFHDVEVADKELEEVASDFRVVFASYLNREDEPFAYVLSTEPKLEATNGESDETGSPEGNRPPNGNNSREANKESKSRAANGAARKKPSSATEA